MNHTPLTLTKKLLEDLLLSETLFFSMYCHVVDAVIRGSSVLIFKPDTAITMNFLTKEIHVFKRGSETYQLYSVDIMSFKKILDEYRLFQASLLGD